MVCRIGARSLEAYHDRELDAAAEARFEAHLGRCAECRVELEALAAEARLFEAYGSRSGREPSPGAWPAIRRAIEDRSAPVLYRGWLGGAAAAVAAAAVLLAGVLVLQRSSPDAPQAPPAGAVAQKPTAAERSAGPLAPAVSMEPRVAEAIPPRMPTRPRTTSPRAVPPAAAIERAEREYVEAIRIAAAAAEARKATLDPVLRSVVETNLEIVDRSIDATRRAYRAHPNDLDLAEYLLSAYSRKLDVLRELGS